MTEAQVLRVIRAELRNQTSVAHEILKLIGLKIVPNYTSLPHPGTTYPDTPEGRWRRRQSSTNYRSTDNGKLVQKAAYARYSKTPKGRATRAKHK